MQTEFEEKALKVRKQCLATALYSFLDQENCMYFFAVILIYFIKCP